MTRKITVSSLLRTGSILAALLWLSACGNVHVESSAVPGDEQDAAYMADTSDSDQDGSFKVASISDDDLSDMRGGFLFAGGLRLDFGLTSTTAINGVIKSSFSFNTSRFNGTLPVNLQQAIQVGTGNNFTSPASAATSQTVLTLVQNTSNNAVIQSSNVLNLSVSNLANFNARAEAFNSLLPFVRALH